VAGTVITALPLDRLTLSPPLGAAELNVTMQASVPAPVMTELLQERALNAAAEVTLVAIPMPVRLTAAVPFRLTTVVPLVEEPLVTVNCPVAVPVWVGLNCIFKL
jgi:hypothetical protein